MLPRWWLHRLVRRRTRPIPEERALVWKRRLSLAYGVLAWNAFGLIVYACLSGRADWAHYHGLKTDEEMATPPGVAYAKMLGIQNAKVFRISGFKKVDEYNIVNGEQLRNESKKELSEEMKD